MMAKVARSLLQFISFHFMSRFLDNIAVTNEPTSVAVKMHRALLDECDDENKAKLRAATEPYSISRNLVQRKHDGNNMEINKMFDAKTKLYKDEIDSISLASAVGGGNNKKEAEKFNHFITTTNDGSRRTKLAHKTEKLNNPDDGSAQSFSDFFKSIFTCSTASAACNKRRINEHIQSDYPLNLHLRLNEVFSMHDKLSDIAENLNDLYSTGRSHSLLQHFILSATSYRTKSH